MVAFESNFLVFLVVVGVLGVLGYGAYRMRDPLFARAFRYFKTWWDRDKLAEAEARRQRDARKQAEVEVRDLCGDAPTEEERVVVTAAATEKPEAVVGRSGRCG